MWFMFGIITLCSAFVATLWWRRQSRWQGTKAQCGGVGYEFLRQLGKKPLFAKSTPVVRIRIGVRGVPQSFHFRLRPEDGYDRAAKRLGISAEQLIGDADFDTRIYLESDDPRVAAALAEAPKVRSALVGLLSMRRHFTVKSIICREGRLWCELTPNDVHKDPIESASAAVVPVLREFADLLETRADYASRSLRDPFVMRAIAILAISSASLIGGGLLTIRALAGRTDILDPWSLFAGSLLVAIPLLLVFVLLSLRLLGRSARAHLVLVEVLLVGSCGFVLSTHALSREANIELDTSAPQVLRVDEVERAHRVSSSRRGGTRHHYYLIASDWPPTVPRRGAIEIDAATYARLGNATSAWLTLREGALGFAWVERIEPAL